MKGGNEMSKASKDAQAYDELTQQLDRLIGLVEWDNVLHSFQRRLEGRQYSKHDKKLLADLREYREARAQDTNPGVSHFKVAGKKAGGA